MYWSLCVAGGVEEHLQLVLCWWWRVGSHHHVDTPSLGCSRTLRHFNLFVHGRWRYWAHNQAASPRTDHSKCRERNEREKWSQLSHEGSKNKSWIAEASWSYACHTNIVGGQGHCWLVYFIYQQRSLPRCSDQVRLPRSVNVQFRKPWPLRDLWTGREVRISKLLRHSTL